MAEVKVTINDRTYAVGCDDGEEAQLRYLGEYVDGRVRELVAAVGQVGEARLLLLAALTIADDLATAYDQIEALRADLEKARNAAPPGEGSARLEALAERLEDIAARLENS